MRFAVFTHVEHQYRERQYFAYPPYVREMKLWFQQVNKIEVVAPLEESNPSTKGLAYQHSNLRFTKIPSFHLLSLGAVFSALFKIPQISYKIIKAMNRADHLHLRCPGNIGLLSCILQIFFPSKPKTAKYAGNWDPEAKQPWTYRLQRWILNNTFLTKNMTVLAYGEWPGQSKNIRSFFTASFSERAILGVQEKTFQPPYTFLFVGNLVPGKQPLIALKMVRELLRKGADCKMEFYGEGPEREALENYIKKEGLEELVNLKGNRSLQELKQAYQRAHFLILPSRSEGWPKAVAEAMFFGCVPIATGVSCVPWMLGGGPPQPPLEVRGGVQRGILIENKTIEEDVERILEVLEDRKQIGRMSKEAKEWSQQYTLERFQEGIKEVLS